MIRVFAFNGMGQKEVDDLDRISDLIADPGTIVWADVLKATEDEMRLIQDEFALHPLAVEDASKHGQRPKLEIYDEYGFVVAYASMKNHTDLFEVDVFIGHNWMITIHEHATSGAHFDIEAVRERYSRTLTKTTTVAFLLYTVLDEIVDTYFGATEALGEEIDDIEERIFNDADPEKDERPMQREMLEVRKALLTFRRKVVPMREVLLMLLRDDLPFVDPHAHHYFQDVLDHIMRITDEIDNHRELIGNAVDAHLAMVSNQMNQTMKKMTSWGAILIVSTLITGIFGMNFREMDFLDSPHAFRITILVMVGVTFGLYYYFKRKGWI